MMTSVDGRIDCATTEHLPGVQEYYDTLDALDAPTRISGRVTAELEMALPGKFEAKTAEALGKEAFSKAADAEGYEIVVDTCGTLLWDESAGDERPLLILTSEQVSILICTGIDGRGGMQSVFDGLPMERGVTPLKLTSVQQYGSGAVWLRYNVEK